MSQSIYRDGLSPLVVCVLPQGTGLNQRLVLQAGNQNSTAVFFSYYAPVVASYSPSLFPTSGATNLTLTGRNFGCFSGVPSAYSISVSLSGSSIATVSAPIAACNDSRIVCTIPAGTGAQMYATVTVSSQIQNGAIALGYSPPIITRVSGCSIASDTATSAMLCPTAGGTRITITGSNFGSANASVTVHGVSCTSVQYEVAHTKISCLTPTGLGFSQAVVVTVSGQSASQNYLNYAGPIFVANSLSYTSMSTNVTLPNNTGGQVVFFQAYYLNTTVSSLKVSYGPSSSPYLYTCTVLSSTLAQTNLFNVTCRVQAGVGNQMALTVNVTVAGLGVQVSAPSTDLLAYPRPVLFSSSLHPVGVNGATGFIGTSSSGEVVYFNGNYLGSDVSLLTVYYGLSAHLSSSPYGSSVQQCLTPSLDYLSANTSQISCRTQRSTSTNSGLLVFLVIALNQASLPGTDTYSYPVPPTVSNITATGGCTNIVGGTIADCPTSGGVLVTITGTGFTATLLSVQVGPSACVGASLLGASTTKLTCYLPTGAGFDQLVTVTSGSVFSDAVPLVSYASPVLTRLTTSSGGSTCVADSTVSLGLTQCPRSSDPSVVLSLEGTNFGASGANVLIGGVAATTVQHSSSNPHGHVSFRLPSGTGSYRDVMLIQNGGLPSTTIATVSYQPCGYGYYTNPNPNTYDCLACPRGTFGASQGSSKCSPCASGYYTSVPNSTTCSLCPPGSISVDSSSEDDTGPTACTPCSIGTYAASYAQSQCIACSAGTYAPTTNATGCVSCPAGRHAAAAGMSSCTVSPNGTYTSEGAFAPLVCPPGTYSTGDAASCVPCKPGWSQSLSGQSSCTPCSPGFAARTSRQATCLPCDSGSFANATAMSECIKCPSGSYSVQVLNVGASACTPCPIGQYIDVSGQVTCLHCSPGTVSRTLGSVRCRACESGTHTLLSLGNEVCTSCIAGKFASSAGAWACLDCDPGRYTDTVGQSICRPCAAGKFVAAPGASVCDNTAVDYVTLAPGQSSQRACADGSYAATPGLSTCTPCTPGWYKKLSTAPGVCTAAPAGSYVSSSGQADYVWCSSGSYSQGLNNTECTPCSAGSYAASPGLSDCTPCGTGTYASSVGAHTCLACPAGTYAPRPGAVKCISCPAGSAQGSSGTFNCSVCVAGQYSAAANQGVCISCPSGKFSASHNATSCSPCPAGWFQSASGQASCQQCPTGTFTNTTGQAACTDCPSGQYASLLASTSCTPCPEGQFAPAPGVALCSICNAGWYGPSTGLFSCLPCAAGTASSAVGASNCSACPAGRYQSQTGQRECGFCPQSQYAPRSGAVTCIACPAGTFSALTDAEVAECTLCSPGYYQQATGQSSCIPCALGKYQVFSSFPFPPYFPFLSLLSLPSFPYFPFFLPSFLRQRCVL